MTQAINLIDGLDGLAAGIVAIAAGAFFLYSQQARPTSACSTRPNIGPLSRSSPSACASGSCRTTSTRRGSSWATAARCCSACCWPCRRASSAAAPTRASEFIGQTYFFFAPLVHPAVDPRRADPRHAVRDRPPRHPAPGARHRRQGPPPPPPDEPRPRPPPQRADPVGVDGAAVGLRALSGAHRREPDATCRSASAPSALVLYTVLHPSVRRKRAMAVEAALDRPASEQVDPSRPERREAAHVSGGAELAEAKLELSEAKLELSEAKLELSKPVSCPKRVPSVACARVHKLRTGRCANLSVLPP